MIDINIIKPKRIKEDLFAYMDRSSVVLDFCTSKIYIPVNSNYSSCKLSHKDLFNFQYDNAISCEEESFILPAAWNNCTINSNDSSVLSSFSSMGEDEFFIGNLSISKNLIFKLYGFTFCGYYNSLKVRDGEHLNTCIDYNVFYYLFQMFKNLSGKKINQLLFSKTKDYIWLTNESRLFYILIKENINTLLKYKVSCIEPINNRILNKDFSSSQIVDKRNILEAIETSKKHLFRPLSEEVEYSHDNEVDKYSNKDYAIWIMKKK